MPELIGDTGVDEAVLEDADVVVEADLGAAGCVAEAELIDGDAAGHGGHCCEADGGGDGAGDEKLAGHCRVSLG